MTKIIKPIKVIDTEIYKAIYHVDGKIYLTKIDPSQELTDSLTIYSSVEEYEKLTGDILNI